MNRKRSIGLYQKALGLIPGGVNSPVRAFKAIGIPPTFVDRAKGAKIWDVDGNEYIDYIGSWGPMIVGHAHPKVVAALKNAIPKGTSFGAPTPLEVELAARGQKGLPFHGTGQDGQLRHRGCDQCHSGGERFYRKRQDP